MNQLFKFINNLNAGQRAVIAGGFSLLFVLLIGLLVYSNIKAENKKFNYTIASNLTRTQVMLASDELENSGIPFTVIGTGDSLTLKTSKEFINIAKIKLVTSEASTNKHVGWEIFEKSSLGTTNFENRVKYLMALEGELSRSLESLSGILRANVKIAIPKRTIFTEEKTEPSASAVLVLKPGVFLTQKQINGIKNFIASAVSDLKNQNIKLIDQDGSLLEHSKDEVDNIKSLKQNKYKEKLELNYEKKIISLLEPIVGSNRIVAKVTINLNFIKKHIQQEIYDPEGTIRSQETTENTSSSNEIGATSNTAAGVNSNIQEPQNANSNTGSNSSNESTKTLTNYEISKKIIEENDNNYSTIKKISAAVTFDSSILDNIENKDEFITSMEDIVKDTIAFDQKRGDNVSVKSFKFVGLNPLGQNANTKVDENGNLINSNSVSTLTLIKTLLKDFSEYIKYLIVAILLFFFYRKFIVNHEVVLLGDAKTSNQKENSNEKENLVDDMLTNFEDEFDVQSAKGRLKSKIKSQIMNNLSGLDEESSVKYEVLIEELDKKINANPNEMAKMIELLLSENDSKFKSSKG